MKTCKMWWLILAVLFVLVGCDTDTAGKTTDGTNAVEWDGTYVYTSRVVSIPTTEGDNEFAYTCDNNRRGIDVEPLYRYYSAIVGDDVYLPFYGHYKTPHPEFGYKHSFNPGFLVVNAQTKELRREPMDSRLENSEYILNVDPSMLLSHVDRDGEEEIGAVMMFNDLYGMVLNGNGDRLMLYDNSRRALREDYDPFEYYITTKPDGTEVPVYTSPYTFESELTLAVYNADGSLRYEISVTEYLNKKDWDMYAYKEQSCVITDDGTVCLRLDKKLFFFDAEGNCYAQQELTVNDLWKSKVTLHRTPDDVIYLKLVDEQNHTWKYCTVDMKTGTLGELQNAPVESTMEDVFFGAGGVLYTSDDINLYRHDAQGGKELLFDWMSVGIIGARIDDVYLRGENNFTVITRDMFQNIPEIVFIDYVRSDSVKPKTEIVIAAGNYTGQALKTLQTAVQLFNRKSEDYTVTVDYYDPAGSGMFSVNQQIANDMANGKQIDLIVFHEDITMEYFDNLGILGDWYPLMDADDTYTRDAFLPCIRAAYETPDGRLPVLTTDFSLTTLVGSTELIGARDHWTYEECLDYVNSLDWDEILLQIERPKGSTDPDAMLVLRSFLPMVLDDYIDEENGTCSLDSESFVELLNLCAALIIDHEVAAFKANDLSVEELIYEGMGFVGEYRTGHTVLFNEAWNEEYGKHSVQHPSAVLNLLVNFYKDHESLSFIGYPMPSEDSGIGTAVTPMLQFGLTASAAHVDGVWTFMREYLSYMETREQSYNYDNRNVYGLPCTYASLDALLDYYEGHAYLIAGGPSIQESSTIEDVNSSPPRSPYLFDADPRVRSILTDLLEKTTRRYSGNTAVMDIIFEEASAYYGGIRTIEETVKIMQSRVGIWLAEHVR